MRHVHDLSPDELASIVTLLQQALYLDCDSRLQLIWNPAKPWDGADVCDQLAEKLAEFDLVPASVRPA